jgi:hypothetical protein
VKDIRDKARAIEMYARQAQNTEAERQACEIRLRAERKCGQLTEEMVTAPGARTDLTSYHDDTKLAALTKAGISKVQASQWERLAAIPAEHFEADLADPMWRPTTSGLLERQDAREPEERGLTDLCIRCGALPATKSDWLHCEPCFQDVCEEVHQAERELNDREDLHEYQDDIGKLMLDEGIGFIEAVERLAKERGLQ